MSGSTCYRGLFTAQCILCCHSCIYHHSPAFCSSPVLIISHPPLLSLLMSSNLPPLRTAPHRCSLWQYVWPLRTQKRPCCLLRSVFCFPSIMPWPCHTQHTLSPQSLSILFSFCQTLLFPALTHYLVSSQVQCPSNTRRTRTYRNMHAGTSSLPFIHPSFGLNLMAGNENGHGASVCKAVAQKWDCWWRRLNADRRVNLLTCYSENMQYSAVTHTDTMNCNRPEMFTQQTSVCIHIQRRATTG